uniref:Large ribosomal subunit protein uL3c n=1 Tax=Cyanophora paradoxa TaxID=2762 RepID=RK3_CYAPA|nr:ribosomal protein L3 [Cyanophora paradoxa]P15766.1 RecName: Full=Large ribosomal subunit protein uL3c; AltName: Full=50S ribosomal protein L3, cyanelle [Cyanophora paradoxa]AAA81231.1 ribosomal protein L3 [Cyanophora paradoxa]CAC35457.1 L3 ribosomal protein [Cyanophora paradoxa]
MSIGILGTKLGMTQIFDEAGNAIPVTIIQAGPCPITQIKTTATDGYNAIQVGYRETKEKNLTKAQLGHLQKTNNSALRVLQEFSIESSDSIEVEKPITVELFNDNDIVNIQGYSIGRGFSGYQKRHNFARGPMSHGSKNHRLPGSIGAGSTPGRVYPGTRMAGRKGDSKITIRGLKIVKVDSERSLLIVKGSVPGKPGGLLTITQVKKV